MPIEYLGEKMLLTRLGIADLLRSDQEDAKAAEGAVSSIDCLVPVFAMDTGAGQCATLRKTRMPLTLNSSSPLIDQVLFFDVYSTAMEARAALKAMLKWASYPAETAQLDNGDHVVMSQMSLAEYQLVRGRAAGAPAVPFPQPNHGIFHVVNDHRRAAEHSSIVFSTEITHRAFVVAMSDPTRATTLDGFSRADAIFGGLQGDLEHGPVVRALQGKIEQMGGAYVTLAAISPADIEERVEDMSIDLGVYDVEPSGNDIRSRIEKAAEAIDLSRHVDEAIEKIAFEIIGPALEA